MILSVRKRVSGGKASVQTQLTHTRLHAHLVGEVLGQIVSGELTPGSTLQTETEMAQHYGVSRVVVREAVRVLAEKGLVEVRQGRGTMVAAPEHWSHLDPQVLMARLRTGSLVDILDNLMEVRQMVEKEAAALAARHASPEEMAELARLVEQMEQVMDSPPTYSDLDTAFHGTLVQATHNLLLRSMVQPLIPVIHAGRSLTNQEFFSIRAESQAGHRAILAAVAARDEEAARAAMEHHVRQFERDMRNTLTRRSGRTPLIPE